MDAPKVAVTARVLVGPKEVFTGGRMTWSATTVQTVIDWALEKAAARAGRSLIFNGAEACQTEAAMERRGTELDIADLFEMTFVDLRNNFGHYLRCSRRA